MRSPPWLKWQFDQTPARNSIPSAIVMQGRFPTIDKRLRLCPVAENSRRQEQHRPEEREQRLECHPDQAKRQRHQPHQGPQQQREQGEWPTKHEQNEPTHEGEQRSHPWPRLLERVGSAADQLLAARARLASARRPTTTTRATGASANRSLDAVTTTRGIAVAVVSTAGAA